MHNNTIPEDFPAFLDRYRRFLLIGHAEPDGDCIGSALALSSYLTRKGKETRLYSPGPFIRQEIERYKSYFSTHIYPKEVLKPSTAAIILDCSTLERIGKLSREIKGLEVAVIDHHAAGRVFGEPRFIDTKAPSTSVLVQMLIESIDADITQKEAFHILFGLCTDTGFFRHLDAFTGEVFSQVARLVEYGASPKIVYDMIFGGNSLESRKLLAELLLRTESYYDRRLYFTYEYREDIKKYGKKSRDSDTLYKMLFATSGCEAIILVREEDIKSTSVSLRSVSNLDVASIAKEFGGGGHFHAAGFETILSPTEIKDKILKKISGYFF